MIRVLVTGDRNWYCGEIARRCVAELIRRHGVSGFLVCHGGANGVDRAFRDACVTAGATHEEYAADWSVGKSAGPARNARMIAAGATYCLAAHQRLASSKGTRDCVVRCLKAGIPVWAIEGYEMRQDGLPVLRRLLTLE